VGRTDGRTDGRKEGKTNGRKDEIGEGRNFKEATNNGRKVWKEGRKDGRKGGRNVHQEKEHPYLQQLLGFVRGCVHCNSPSYNFDTEKQAK
jgi:hypothetical protein